MVRVIQDCQFVEVKAPVAVLAIVHGGSSSWIGKRCAVTKIKKKPLRVNSQVAFILLKNVDA